MAFDVTGLTDFVKGQSESIIEPIVLAANSFQLGLSEVDDVKYKILVPNIYSVDVTLQGGDPSDTTANGDDVLDEISLETTQLTLHKRYSTYALDKSVYALGKKMGSAADDDAYLSAIAGLTGKELAYQNDRLLWQGDSSITGTTNNLRFFDGFVKTILASGNVIKTGTAAAAFTAATAVSKVELMISTAYANKPELADVKTRIFVSPENFYIYLRALTKNNAAIDLNTISVDGGVKEVQVPGTNAWVTAVAGLGGSNEVIMSRPENLIIASDIATEASNVSLDYLNEAMKYRLMAVYKLGIAVANFGEIVVMAA